MNKLLIIRHLHDGWGVKITSSEITFHKELEGQQVSRTYDLPAYEGILLDGQYVNIFCTEANNDELLIFKMEDESCIIGDKWDSVGKNHLDTIGCYDLAEDLV